jgi:hypothetical protein
MKATNQKYLIYLVIMMGLVAIMDQYLSTINSSARPYILQEYNLRADQFAWLESLFLASTFFI